MSPRGFLIVGAVWFLAAVALGIRLARTDFAIGWAVKGPVTQATSLFAIYFMLLVATMLLIGWAIPVAVGVYRLLKR